MCGIAGWFSDRAVSASQKERLRAMVRAIAHRGPDGQGVELVEHAALGHARLAVIDLQDGRQPMTDAQNLATIVFNGEIYNYRALADELASRGICFLTQSDTEVVLQLYLTEGPEGFSRLRGMYAFAIWDRRRQTGILARDPLGIKPLFLCDREGAQLFGSEAKAILAAGAPGQLDEAALHLLLNFRYLPGTRSLFRGIRQLAPGEILQWRPERPVTTGFCAPSAKAPRLSVLKALADTVQAHLTADVQVGAYLSGGIDSATVVALAQGGSTGVLPTFTLDVGDDPQEASNAAETARLFGVSNSQAKVGQPPAEALPTLVRHLEVPKVNAWQVGEIARHAVQHVKVVLSGLGGDELFYGYNMHRIMELARVVEKRSPRFARRLAGRTLARLARLTNVPWPEVERAGLMANELGNWPRVYGLLRNVWDRPDLRRLLYGPRMLDAALPDAFSELEHRWPQSVDPVDAAAQFEWREKMVNDLLWQEDRCSMAVGLEVRVPFVDALLAQNIQRFSRPDLMPRNNLKGLLRESLREVLPAQIMNRPKSGFQVNAPRFWQSLEPLAGYWLDEPRIRSYGLFNPEFVRRLRRMPPEKGLRWHFFVLYLMLATHLWLDTFESPAETLG